jgi:hypothetical protein
VSTTKEAAMYEFIGKLVVWYTITGIALLVLVCTPICILQYLISADSLDGCSVDPIYDKWITPHEYLKFFSTMRYKDPRLAAKIVGEIGIQCLNYVEKQFDVHVFIA